MNFLQFDFETHNREETEKLVALLAEQGFDGFEEDGMTLIAFVPESKFNNEAFEKTLERFSILSYAKTVIENINWNQQWEEGFEPVLVDDFAAIRAHFHKPVKNVQHEIIITPKMSFGTGHHATTYMMVQQMKAINFSGKAVLDFGTGTGVLAILAAKSGAASILAIDNDEWSITNAKENCIQNNCKKIIIQQADQIPLSDEFDIILANINLNVIQANLSAMVAVALPGAKILLSGFLATDKSALTESMEANQLKELKTCTNKEWLCILCKK